jgi:hypothetical protein
MATAANWPDALAIGPAAAALDQPLVLSPPTGLYDAPEPQPVHTVLQATLAGGEDVLSPAAAAQAPSFPDG